MLPLCCSCCNPRAADGVSCRFLPLRLCGSTVHALYGHQRALNRTLKRRKVNSAGGLIKTTYNSRDSGTYRETQTHTQEQTHTHPGSDTCVCWLSERAMVTHSYTWEQPEPSSLLIVFSLTSSSFPVAPLYRFPFPFSLLPLPSPFPFSLSLLPTRYSLSLLPFPLASFLCPFLVSAVPVPFFSSPLFSRRLCACFCHVFRVGSENYSPLSACSACSTACPGTGACLKSPRAAFRFHYTSKSLTHLCSKEHISCGPLMRRDQSR